MSATDTVLLHYNGSEGDGLGPHRLYTGPVLFLGPLHPSASAMPRYVQSMKYGIYHQPWPASLMVVAEAVPLRHVKIRKLHVSVSSKLISSSNEWKNKFE